MINAIITLDSNFGIGDNDDLFLSIPESLKEFKELTSRHTTIMTLNTWNNLPDICQPLLSKKNIIISNHQDNNDNFYTLEQVIRYVNKTKEDVFIIGGEAFNLLLPYCNKIYSTNVLKEFKNVNDYFIDTDFSQWYITSQNGINLHRDTVYQITIYERKTI